MTCPKCHGDMRSYERNGVTVEQCSECRGLFLDRGELERLVEAKGSFYREPPKQRYDERSGYGDSSHHGKHYTKRKKNFLEELFD